MWPRSRRLLAVSGSDLVLIAVPVAATEPTLRAIRHLVAARHAWSWMQAPPSPMWPLPRKRCLAPWQRISCRRIPIAGKELVWGERMPTPLLFQGRQVVITPHCQRTIPRSYNGRQVLGRGLGCKVLKMTPENP